VVRARQAEFDRNRAIAPPAVIVGRFDPGRQPLPPDDSAGSELQGLPVSAGVITGPVRVMLRANDNGRMLPGEILVAPFTNPDWTPHFLTATGLVTDIGGQLSHGSVVAREVGRQ
jgi:phosphoenolpyruvate synthase/pyruvate phosphate dikinase